MFINSSFFVKNSSVLTNSTGCACGVTVLLEFNSQYRFIESCVGGQAVVDKRWHGLTNIFFLCFVCLYLFIFFRFLPTFI